MSGTERPDRGTDEARQQDHAAADATSSAAVRRSRGGSTATSIPSPRTWTRGSLRLRRVTTRRLRRSRCWARRSGWPLTRPAGSPAEIATGRTAHLVALRQDSHAISNALTTTTSSPGIRTSAMPARGRE